MRRLRRALAAFCFIVGLATLEVPNAFGSNATSNYRCHEVISVGWLRSLTGLRLTPASANSRAVGTRVTCTFVPVPAWPSDVFEFKKSGRLQVTVSSRPADLALLTRRFRQRLGPLPGLGSHALESVSPLGQLRIIAIAGHYEVDISRSDPRFNPFMMMSIAREVYAAAGRR